MFDRVLNTLKRIYKRVRWLRPSLDALVESFWAQDQPKTFQEVGDRERDEINASRTLRGQQPYNNDLVGVSFSGGGIRSATFNLGMLQGLASRNYLRQIDYLSTVSGGGYIGAWLVAWIRRAGAERVQERLTENLQSRPVHEAGRYLEPDQVRFLRKYSKYLTPRAGLLSTDTWAALAVYFRNLTLNLALLILSGVCALLVPDFVLWALKTGTYPSPDLLLVVLVITLVLLMSVVGIAFGALSTQSPARRDWRRHIVDHVGIWTSVPLSVAAVSATVLLGFCDLYVSTNWQLWVLSGAGAYLGLWLISTAARLWCRGGEEPEPVEEEPAFRLLFPIAITLLVGALQGYTTYWSWRMFQYLYPNPHSLPLTVGGGIVALAVFGPALLVAVVLLTSVFHMGLAGRALPDANREWLARATAVVSLITLTWIVLCSASLYGPLWVKWLTESSWAKTYWGGAFKWALPAAWAVVTGGGIAAGRSSSTSGKGDDRFQLIARVAPSIFALGLVLLFSFGLDALLAHSTSRSASSPIGNHAALVTQHWNAVNSYLGWNLLAVMITGLLGGWILGNRVDVNEFSMHLFYRNRLTRAYLGASQYSRQSDPFTGFSVADDVRMRDLATDVEQKREPLDAFSPPPSATGRYDGPYPIFNTAINLVRGRELAWQTRKAASFIYTPLFCGYDYYANQPGWVSPNFYSSAYRPTARFGRRGGLHLGTPMAISGAAASPNMGYHTSPGLAFLMTVFNVRLGWWAGNPRHHKTWRRLGPAFGLFYLFREIFPSTNDEMRYVYLSDGGHFENLGVYELVRRECRFIIVCDADCDPDRSFDNLGNAVEKCRRDFGAEIDIRIAELKRRPASGKSKAHFALGTIRYHDQREPGLLLYVKPTLNGDEPEDVQAYAAKHPSFPHDTTADQFFDESQFESYRALGEHIFDTLIGLLTSPVVAGGPRLPPPKTVPEFFTALQTYFQQHPVSLSEA